MAEQRRLHTLLGHLKAKPGSAAAGGGQLDSSRPEGYRYTLDASSEGVLSREQRQSYEEKGFFVVKGLVSQHHLDTYRERFRQLCNREVKIPGLSLMKDVSVAKGELKEGEEAINNNFQFDPVLVEYCKLPEVVRYVECITGPDIMAMHTMLINKPPDTGSKSSRHPMHQDLHYFSFRPTDSIVCSWTAMEHVHKQNGCLVVLPGTHKTHLLPHNYPKWEGGVNKMYYGIMDYDPSHPRHHLEMQAGDTVFFHPLLIHGSGRNRTNGFRKAISTHFASSHCHYIDVEGTTQEMVQDEIGELAKKKLGPDAKFTIQMLWESKGVCVKGERVNL